MELIVTIAVFPTHAAIRILATETHPATVRPTLTLVELLLLLAAVSLVVEAVFPAVPVVALPVRAAVAEDHVPDKRGGLKLNLNRMDV